MCTVLCVGLCDMFDILNLLYTKTVTVRNDFSKNDKRLSSLARSIHCALCDRRNCIATLRLQRHDGYSNMCFWLLQCIKPLIESPSSPIMNKKNCKIHVYTMSQKGCHFYFCNNFGKCRPILIILSLLYSQIYCRGRY